MKKILTLFFFTNLLIFAKAIDNNFQTTADESSITKNLFTDGMEPVAYKIFKPDESQLFNDLFVLTPMLSNTFKELMTIFSRDC